MRLYNIVCLGVSSVSALQASVYSLPRSFASTAWGSITADTARHVLLRAFGVHDYWGLNFQSDGLGMAENVWDEKRPRMLIMVEGVVDPEELLGDVSPRYHIEDFLYSNVYGELFREFAEKIQDVKGESGIIFENEKGTIMGSVPATEIQAERERFGDIFSKFDSSRGEDLEELTALKELVQSLKGDVCALIHSSSLGDIYHKYGGESSEYQSGIKLLAGVFATLLDSQALVVCIPPGGMHGKRGPSEGVFTTPVKLASGSCYQSRQVCEKVTGNCSEHGSCLEYHGMVDCWTCQCTRSVEERTRGEKSTYWTGPACETKNILSEFQLFFWFGVSFLGAILWSVSLMYSVGSEELGGVFQGVSSAKKY
ncbi:putative endoplasmic reticulum membrane protein [Neolecta irregularis DAH-3]|uniref:Putative endoplasmic reticulum membrane protein n=1 Tax=Neolecta irregularis (strain DAH-3) TaxID=1198029 RepID=A0A1U7LSM4_NEOID|nr:putative endoplasmic reticulum membrane protein [Neolecta irregularis DAH-3]|eukprot:OLL25583.1 putative endoplasmic reticulum membrane protein [Neolecta irregularis DAH-3]